MSIQSSARLLAKATTQELESHKKWLSKYSVHHQCLPSYFHYETTEMDAKMANIPFFALENVSQWAVLEKWHEYQLIIRRQLNTSDSYRSYHFGCLNSCRCL